MLSGVGSARRRSAGAVAGGGARIQGGGGAPRDVPALRLAVSRGTLGIELEAPFALGSLTLQGLAFSLPHVRFPVDLSGGVSRFRHHRGELSYLQIMAPLAELRNVLRPKLRGVFGEVTPELLLVAEAHSLLVALHVGDSALAFDVVLIPRGHDLWLVPMRARGFGEAGPPHVVALRVLHAMAAPYCKVERGRIVLDNVLRRVLLHALPLAGARLPDSDGTVFCAEPRFLEGSAVIEAENGAAPPELSNDAVLALNTLELVGDADHAAFTGDYEAARTGYLQALERAPRHLEISERLAWIDHVVFQRPEAGLATLVDALPAIDAGILGAELLLRCSDPDAARPAFETAAKVERCGVLAAICQERVAGLAATLGEKVDALGEAIARAPARIAPRWARLELFLRLGDVSRAVADAEHLEAVAHGLSERREVWKRAADLFLNYSQVAVARTLYEKALRYGPTDEALMLGIARALNASNEPRRALDVLIRASETASRAGRVAPEIELELGRALVEVAGDRPAAVARVRRVSQASPEAVDARYWEGKWRSELGDNAGASLSFGRLLDACEARKSMKPPESVRVAHLLLDAAKLESDQAQNPLSARRLLTVALGMAPRDQRIALAFRAVCAELEFKRGSLAAAENAHPLRVPTPEPPIATPIDVEPAEPEPDDSSETSSAMMSLLDSTPAPAGTAQDEQLVEALTERLRADPSNAETVYTLASALERLGRDLDLLALFSARIEEGDSEMKQSLIPRRQALLRKLADAARERGSASEAELYELLALQEV